MKYCNLINILVKLGYTIRGAKGIISRRKKELDLSIDDYEKVNIEDAIRILDTLSKKGMASLVRKFDEFLDKVEAPSDMTISEEKHDIPEDEGNKPRKKGLEINLLTLKEKNLGHMNKGVPTPGLNNRRDSKKYYGRNIRNLR